MKNILFLICGLIVVSSFSVSPAQAQEQEAPAMTGAVLSFRQGALKAAVAWEAGYPAVVGPEAKLVIQWMDQNHQPVELGADFRVALFMPEMGHGSSPTKIAKLEGAGLYRISKIYFTMPGRWDVQVTLKPVNGEAPETQTFSLML